MDIIEYIEKVCEFPLCGYQKDFVRKYYDARENNKQLIISGQERRMVTDRNGVIHA